MSNPAEPSTPLDTSSRRFYHGTRADLKPADLIQPGYASNYTERRSPWVYFSLTRDGGRTWTDITPRDLPATGTVNRIELSPHAPGRAFLAVHRYRLDDFAPYIFRTDDFGRTWTRLTDGKNGIPA